MVTGTRPTATATDMAIQPIRTDMAIPRTVMATAIQPIAPVTMGTGALIVPAPMQAIVPPDGSRSIVPAGTEVDSSPRSASSRKIWNALRVNPRPFMRPNWDSRRSDRQGVEVKPRRFIELRTEPPRAPAANLPACVGVLRLPTQEGSMSRIHNVPRRGGLLGLAIFVGTLTTFVASAEIRAQGNVHQMDVTPKGDVHQLEGAPQGTVPKQSATATGTVTAVNPVDHNITVNHGAIPEIKWPAMKMEFPVVSSLDLSKVKVGEKVRFTITGSGNSYTVQSINPAR